MPSSAVAVPLIGSVAGPVVSAVLGSGSNKKAAQASAQGKDQQLALASGQVATNTAAFQPYTTSGSASQALLNNYLGVDTPATPATPGTAAFTPLSYNDWAAQQGNGSNGFNLSLIDNPFERFLSHRANNNASQQGYQSYLNSNPARAATAGTAGINAVHDSNFGSLLKPYNDGKPFSFTNADFVKDPGYQFRLDEGIKGLDNASLARGAYNSGAALKALDRYNQDYASSEFGNAYSRASSDFTNNFNRDASNKSRTYDFLTGNTNRGANSVASNASASAGLINGASTAIANNATNQGNYAVNGASAINNAVQGGLSNYLYDQRQRNYPPANSSVVGATDLYGGGYSKPSWMVN